jgi:hypothetical protein
MSAFPFLRRFTITIVDQKSGIERRATVAVAAAVALAILPLVILIGVVWKSKTELQALHASHRALAIETANYRAAVEALTAQLGSQQSAVRDLPPDSGASDSAQRGSSARTSVGGSTPIPQAAPVPASSQKPGPAVHRVRPAAVGGRRGVEVDEDAGREVVMEALARSGQRRRSSEAADAPVLASGSYRAGLDLELEAEVLSTTGRTNVALARAVEADARFRAAEIEARAQAAARERLARAEATAAVAAPPVPHIREVPAERAGSPRGELPEPFLAPVASMADVENTIRGVIAQYVSGLESQSLPALKRVWPSLSGSQERAIQEEFENARTVQTVFKDPRISINGDVTTVTGLRMHNLVTQDGQRLSSVTRTTMTLRRNGEVWVIDHIVHQQ